MCLSLDVDKITPTVTILRNWTSYRRVQMRTQDYHAVKSPYYGFDSN